MLEVNEKSIRIFHEMTHDDTGEVAATTVIVSIHIDATTRRARRMPADVRKLTVIMVHDTDSGVAQDDTDSLLELRGGCRRTFYAGAAALE